MKNMDVSRCALGICVAGAMLAGCNGLQPPIGASGAISQTSAFAAHVARAGASWMLPEAKSIKRLLYLSDGSQAVYVYDYANGKQVGELTGLNGTSGECVDAKGDVFIANFTGGDVVKYARGGTKPLATFHTNGNAIGCAVDKNDDLAAANLYDFSSYRPGALCLWKHGKGNGACYLGTGPCFYIYSPGYDDKGNVIFEGQGDIATGVCAVLSGTSKVTTLSYNGASCCGGAVMWDGKYIAVTDLEVVGSSVQTTIARATLSGTTLTIRSETSLSDTCGVDGGVEVNAPFIVGTKNTPVNDKQGTALIGGNLACDGSGGLAFWHYPPGGNPYRSVGFAPAGEAVSIASIR
jgi:hypothetical protein